MAFLLDEDAAIKSHFGGLTVTDQSAPTGGRSVLVRFRMPEPEEAPVAFPMIAIDLTSISESPPRNMRGRVNLSRLHYNPNGEVPAAQNGASYISDYPIPVDLDYQVEVVSRHARHDRQLQSLIWNKVPGRFGVLRVNDTDRTMQLLGSVNGDRIDEHGKRLFRKIYTVRVCSELFPNLIKSVANLTTINISISVLDPILVGLTATSLNCSAE